MVAESRRPDWPPFLKRLLAPMWPPLAAIGVAMGVFAAVLLSTPPGPIALWHLLHGESQPQILIAAYGGGAAAFLALVALLVAAPVFALIDVGVSVIRQRLDAAGR